MKKFHLIFVSLILLLNGCASSLMKPALQQTLTPPPKDKAEIVFMRTSLLGAAIQASVFDVTSENPEFIGISSYNTKIPYITTPGKHLYMVVGESADFMAATVSAGKTYYAIVSPRIGFWKARFSLLPIHSDPNAEFSTQSSDFDSWLSDTKIVENTPASEKWAKDNAQSILSKYTEYLKKWNAKSATDKAARSIFARDGQ